MYDKITMWFCAMSEKVNKKSLKLIYDSWKMGFTLLGLSYDEYDTVLHITTISCHFVLCIVVKKSATVFFFITGGVDKYQLLL